MTVKSGEVARLLAFAVDLAREAGEMTLSHFRRPINVERKADGSFVTPADREAEAHLRRRIKERFPQDGILGEEEGALAGTSGRRWLIDPIDGTFSFVHGVPLFGVLVALESNDEPLIGVVNIPRLDELVSAARGLGCFLNGERAHVSSTAEVEEALLLATDFGVCEQYGFGAAARRLQNRAGARRTWGDCYGHVLVATGRAEVMLDPVVKLWDCAPLLPILEEAGGTFTDWRGRRTIHGGNAISTNGKVFDEVMKLVKSDGD